MTSSVSGPRRSAARRSAPGATRCTTWSRLAAGLVRAAMAAGRRGEVADLGPRALDVCNSVSVEDIAPGVIRHVGIARDGQWVAWYPPVPAEPVPGSPEQRGGRN
jgi:hypothetical protein